MSEHPHVTNTRLRKDGARRDLTLCRPGSDSVDWPAAEARCLVETISFTRSPESDAAVVEIEWLAQASGLDTVLCPSP